MYQGYIKKKLSAPAQKMVCGLLCGVCLGYASLITASEPLAIPTTAATSTTTATPAASATTATPAAPATSAAPAMLEASAIPDAPSTTAASTSPTTPPASTPPAMPTVPGPAAGNMAPPPDLSVIEEGKHYQRLPEKVTKDKKVLQFLAENPGKIQVVEFFSYACFWCQQLHPLLDEWVKKKPENVVFFRFPLVWNKKWEPLAKAFLLIQTLGKNQTLDREFFTALHQKRIDLSDEKELKKFFVEQGVSEKQFSELFNAFTTNTQLIHAKDLANAYQIVLSPVIVVNAPSGSYIVAPSMTGSLPGVITVLEHIIAREQKKNG